MNLTTSQTAVRLKISERHVRRLISDHELPAERIGKLWFIEEETVLLYQKNRGNIEQLKEQMNKLVASSDYLIASPETIDQMKKKKLPIKSKFISYDDYLDNLFKEKREQASKRIESLPKIDEKIANATAEALYNEFRECYLLGVNGAAITLAIVMLDYACKHRLLEEKRKAKPNADWGSVEDQQLKETVKDLRTENVITEEEEAQLLRFNREIRNAYMHYKIRELVTGMVLLELPSVNINTGEVTIDKNVDARTMPHLWFSAKKKRDAETVREISAFCINWANNLLKKAS